VQRRQPRRRPKGRTAPSTPSKVCIIVIAEEKTKFSTTARSKLEEVSSNKCDTDVEPEINMAAETGNANSFGTTVWSETSTANLFTDDLYMIDTGNGNAGGWQQKPEIGLFLFLEVCESGER